MRRRFLPGLEAWAPIGPASHARRGRGLVVPAPAAGPAVCRRPGRCDGGFTSSASAFGLLLANRYKVPHALVEEAGLLRRDDDIRNRLLADRASSSVNFYTQRNVELFPQGR